MKRMREQEIRELLEANNFQPFVLHVSDQAKYEITNRADLWTLRGIIYIGVEPDENGVPTRAIRIDPLHVTRLTPLKTNGSRRRR
jgi:hypothetical protein